MLPQRILDAGRGTPVLFLHAYPLNADMWRPQFDGLSDIARCIAFDLPGVAGGGPARSGLTVETAAEMGLAVLDHLGLERAVIAGCSMGGYIAFAALNLHPERFTGAILADTRMEADTEEGQRNRSAQMEDVRAHGTAGMIDSLLQKLISPATIERDPTLPARVRAMMEQASPEGVISMLGAMRDRGDAAEALARFSRPVCVIVGEEDALTPVAASETMVRQAQRASLHVIPGAGHLSNFEAPAEFNRIVRAFLESLH